MGLTPKVDLALKVLPPTIILEPYFDVLMFLNISDKLQNDPIIDKKKLQEDFFKFLKDYYTKKELLRRKKELQQAFNDVTKRCNSIFWNESEIVITNVDLKNYSEFYKITRHIKKAEKRIIQWAIYYLFNKENKKISVVKLKELIKEFQIKNVETIIKKLIKDLKSEGLKISLVESQIIIDHNNEDRKDSKKIKQILADTLEYYSRRPRGSLEAEILDMLDQGSYSNQEICNILDVDKSHVSKTMKKLLIEKTIKWSDYGLRGSHYYTTNCVNCPFGTNLESCRTEALKSIISLVQKDFGLKLIEKNFEQIENNQSLLYIERILKEGRKDKSSALEINKAAGLNNLFSAIHQEITNKQRLAKPKSAYVNLSKFLEKTSLPYYIGFVQGAQSGAAFMDLFLAQALKPYFTKKQENEVREVLIREFNKVATILNLTKS